MTEEQAKKLVANLENAIASGNFVFAEIEIFNDAIDAIKKRFPAIKEED